MSRPYVHYGSSRLASSVEPHAARVASILYRIRGFTSYASASGGKMHWKKLRVGELVQLIRTKVPQSGVPKSASLHVPNCHCEIWPNDAKDSYNISLDQQHSFASVPVTTLFEWRVAEREVCGQWASACGITPIELRVRNCGLADDHKNGVLLVLGSGNAMRNECAARNARNKEALENGRPLFPDTVRAVIPLPLLLLSMRCEKCARHAMDARNALFSPCARRRSRFSVADCASR